MTGVLQVAGVGAQLCKSLSKYEKDVKNAKKHVDDAATEVSNISSALGSLGRLLQHDETEQGGAATLTDETCSALNEHCSSDDPNLDPGARTCGRGTAGLSTAMRGVCHLHVAALSQ